jgi:hypothetical protein
VLPKPRACLQLIMHVWSAGASRRPQPSNDLARGDPVTHLYCNGPEIFRRLRDHNLSVWARMSREDLQRGGQHTERGVESLAMMLQLLSGHDLSHLQQISRHIQAIESLV